MARIGMFCPPWTGHQNPFAGLAQELAGRGHEVVFFQLPEFAGPLRRRGFRVEEYGGSRYPAGTFASLHAEMSRLEGLPAIRAGLDILRLLAEALFAEASSVIARAKLDLWAVDQLDYAAATLAAVMGAPFVTVIVTLMMHREVGVPGFSGETNLDELSARERDHRFNEEALKASKPFRDYLGEQRIKAGLGPFSYDSLWSGLAQITQQPAEFEFPRRRLPACFHFTGPFTAAVPSPQAPFPWELLNGKPLVYACFGTAQNRNRRLYHALAAALAGLDVQVVLSLGGADASELPEALPENMLIVPYAPQTQILERAALMITHAGMNSVLECLAAGVPMVAVPISHDQPGVAARIEWSGTGVRIAAPECDAARLRRAIETVLKENSYRDAAHRFRRIIAEGDGVRRAARIIERVLATRRPVLRGDPAV